MIFASDNWSGVHPAISESLARNADGMAASYGASAIDRQVNQRFAEIFEHDVAVFYASTGTAANSIALSAFNRPGGKILCHRDAHIVADECGAPDFFSPGARLQPIDGEHGLIDATRLESALAEYDRAFVHGGRPMAISVSQASENGTVYSADALLQIGALAHRYKMPIHMDGARFANAVIATGKSPAELTWRAGINVMSFGGTKNGCWCAEAVVFFTPGYSEEFAFIHKRAGQLFSKSRFVAAQFDAYLADNLWLDLAGHANAMADRLRAGLTASASARLAWPTETNEVFAVLPQSTIETARSQGAEFYDWPADAALGLAEGEVLIRLVTSWSTPVEAVDHFLALVG